MYLDVIGILHRYSSRVGYGHWAGRIGILFVCFICASHLCIILFPV